MRRKRIVDVGPDFQEVCQQAARFDSRQTLVANVIEKAGELAAEMARWSCKGPVFPQARVVTVVGDMLLQLNILLESSEASDTLIDNVVLHLHRRRHQLQSHMESVKAAEAANRKQQPQEETKP